MQLHKVVRALHQVTLLAVGLSAISAWAQQSDSLGDIARRTRAQRESASKEGGAAISQCSSGPISQAQILAWQIAGISPADATASISARGVSFVPGTGSIPASAFTPAVAAALAHAPHAEAETAVPGPVLTNLLQAMQSGQQNEYGKAIHSMQDVIKENPASVDFLVALGSLYVRNRDWANAANSYRQAAQLADKCIYVHRQLTSIYSSMEDVESAEAEARKMAALDPNSADARKYVTRVHALRMNAEHEDIPAGDDVDLSEYENDQHDRVSNEALHYNREGIAKEQQGDPQGAIQAYQRAIAEDPRWWGPRYNLGQTYRRLGRLQDAVQAYQEAKALSPEHLNIRQNLGHCLCQLNRWQEAANEFQEILKIDPTWNMARPCLYQALKAMGREQEAEQVLADDEKYKAQGYDD